MGVDSINSALLVEWRMIDFIQVSKHFGTQDVLNSVSFRINAGDRVGPERSGEKYDIRADIR